MPAYIIIYLNADMRVCVRACGGIHKYVHTQAVARRKGAGLKTRLGTWFQTNTNTLPTHT